MDTSCCGQEGGSSGKEVEILVSFMDGWWLRCGEGGFLELCPTETRFCQPGKSQIYWPDVAGRIEERP